MRIPEERGKRRTSVPNLYGQSFLLSSRRKKEKKGEEATRCDRKKGPVHSKHRRGRRLVNDSLIFILSS